MMTLSPPAQRTAVLTRSADPQGQGREGPRQGHQGGDGRQACEDQGREGEEAGACAAEARCSAGRGRAVDGRHDKQPAWVFSGLKEGVNLLSISAYAVMFHVTSVKDSSLHAYSTDKAAPALITDAMSVPKREMSIGIRNQ